MNTDWLKVAGEVAEARFGVCLSDKYISAKTNLEWKCQKGHIWLACLDRIKNQGCWCPYCAGKAKNTIQIASDLANSKGGQCLSTEYKDAFTLMKWKCREEHTWFACLDSVKNGKTWCPDCCGLRKHTLDGCQKIAEDKDGKCLSEEYKNNHSKMLWECSSGHRWEATLVNVLAGIWCNQCSGFNRVLSMKHAYATAAKHNGRCLSTEYFGNKHRMLWECDKGHTWLACLNNVRNGGGDGNGTWCPVCNTKRSKAEKEVYEFVKSLGVECEYNFPGVLPSRLLRLDVWIPSINKVIELDGKYWHDRPDSIERDIRKDRECEELGIKVLRLDHTTEWYRKNRLIGEGKIRAFLGIKEPLCSGCGTQPRVTLRTVCGDCLAKSQQAYKRKARYPNGQNCVSCRIWCKKSKDLSCRKCRQANGLRLCNVCELILPIAAFFFGHEPYCRYCRLL